MLSRRRPAVACFGVCSGVIVIDIVVTGVCCVGIGLVDVVAAFVRCSITVVGVWLVVGSLVCCADDIACFGVCSGVVDIVCYGVATGVIGVVDVAVALVLCPITVVACGSGVGSLAIGVCTTIVVVVVGIIGARGDGVSCRVFADIFGGMCCVAA